MAADGRLPSIRVGKQLRFSAAEISALIACESRSLEGSHASTPLDPTAATAAITVAAQLLGVMMVATDMAGQPITPIVNQCPWFATHADQHETLAACLHEWRIMASDSDLAPRFQLGSLGYECARVFIRSGSSLVGMIIAGGVAPAGLSNDESGLIQLSTDQRKLVLETLPVVAQAVASAQTFAATAKEAHPSATATTPTIAAIQATSPPESSFTSVPSSSGLGAQTQGVS